MAFFDRLALLTEGVGRGYRASQELQRQIAAEERRRALEEEELQFRKNTAAAEQQYRTNALGLEREKFGEQQRQFNVENEDLIPGGLDLNLQPDTMVGPEPPVPVNRGNVGDVLRFLTEQKDRASRIEHPEVYGGSSRLPKTPEERKADLIRTMVSSALTNPSMFEGIEGEGYQKRTENSLNLILRFLQTLEPDLFPPDTTGTTKIKRPK